VAAARERAEPQMDGSAGRLQRPAELAVAAGQEQLAWQVLALRSASIARASDFMPSRLRCAQPRRDCPPLYGGCTRGSTKAEYAAAQAAASVEEAFGGIPAEAGTWTWPTAGPKT
jgi:hypothetical protein